MSAVEIALLCGLVVALAVAAVALANKTARMVWAIMTSGERYREPLAA